MQSFLRWTLSAAATATLALSSLTGAHAQTRTCTAESPCVLRIATVAPQGTPWAQQLRSMESRIESASGGRINVRPFLGQSDGENSLARQCVDGSLEGVGVSTGALANLVPQLGVFELPFLFDTAEQADRVIDNHLFTRFESILGAAGLQLYIFSENGFRNFASTNGTVIRSSAELRTLQMRAQEYWIHEQMYRALGGNPVTIATPEVTTALTNGTVQGFDNTALFSQAAGWDRFANTWTISNHIYQPAVVVYNKAWFDSLPADLQEILIANRETETRSGRRAIRALTPLLLQNLRNRNMEVVELTAAERQAMAQATQSVHAEFRRRVTGGGELLDIILSNRR
jgi:TRAP-type C4-dicarboxylate transport system substrate-binding protein